MGGGTAENKEQQKTEAAHGILDNRTSNASMRRGILAFCAEGKTNKNKRLCIFRRTAGCPTLV
ncbi:MAG: hypothetical protein KUL87_05600 [Pseudomonas sp.]|nr:hypothetical protein [Pseudomonas sp.]